MIGRKGHEGDENQLTEMAAYLFQEEPDLIAEWAVTLGLPVHDVTAWEVETQRAVPGRFLDLVLFSRGRAVIVVESKLGSTTDYQQITKYIAYLKTVAAVDARALVFTTQNPEPWPAGVVEEAGDEVTLVLRRWQALGDFLRQSDSALARDFVVMLEREGLVKPDALTQNDWEAGGKATALHGS